MLRKNFFSSILFCASFTLLLLETITAQTPCPDFNDLLDKGWGHVGQTPHNPQPGNMDEFAAVNTVPFILKVDDYPPVKSFPIIPECSSEETYYYFSFDTDFNYLPINFRMPRNQPNTVKTYGIDQNGNYTSGYSVIVSPPEGEDVGNPVPDFVMKYNGTMHAVSWNINLYPWSNFVSSPVVYSPSSLQVNILGPSELQYNTSAEYIADINGGSGHYRIEWSARDLPNGTWAIYQDLEPVNYYNLYGENYYFYDNEYKYEFWIDHLTYELKVTIFDLEIGNSVSATKIVSPAPEQVTFINHIQESEEDGDLVLNEDKNDFISSGDYRDLIFGQNYTIRTNELPFLVDFNASGKTEKQNFWEFTSPILYALNKSFTFLPNTERTMKSRFLSTDQAVIKTLIDGVECGTIEFKDPWYYYKDGNNNWYQSNEFKPYTSPLNLFNNSIDSYGGVFLDQGADWQPPYYTVKAPSSLYIPQTGKTHPLYFLGWDYNQSKISLQFPLLTQTGVVFKDNNADLTARLKGVQLSNNPLAYANNSQRKFLRTYYNSVYTLNNVYESLDKVWYETSTDNGVTWKIMNQGKPINENYFSGQPSITELWFGGNPYGSGNDKILIAYQEYYGTYPISSINVVGYDIANDTKFLELLVCDGSFSEVHLTYPVISHSSAQLSGPYLHFLVVFKVQSNNGYEPGLYYSLGVKQLAGGNYVISDPVRIPHTDINSYTPTISTYENHYAPFCKHHLAWEQKISGSNSYISYIELDVTGAFELSVTPNEDSYVENLSTLSGFPGNSRPSIIALPNNDTRIVWIGSRNSYSEGPEGEGGGSVPLVETKVFYKSRDNGNWSALNSYGNNINSLSLNRNDDFSSVFAWSEGSGNLNKFVRSNDLRTIYTTNTTGKYLQVGNYTTLSNSQLHSFSTSTIPFSFSLSNPLIVIPQDENSEREGIITEDTLAFYFSLGEIKVNSESVDFISLPDTLLISSQEDLNSYLVSNQFILNDNSSFTYGIKFGITDSLAAALSLINGKSVNFKVELIDDQTGELLGVLDDVTYSENYIIPYERISYLVNTQGIGNRICRMRIKVNDNINFNYSLVNSYNNETILAKKGFTETSYMGSYTITSYDLNQNFPNPFNPSTTIKYQIPEDGIVSLKIYDILGKEVKSLVNEYKQTGRYEINFDAFDLASGVYIYRIQVNPSTGSGQSFVSAKKMMLVK